MANKIIIPILLALFIGCNSSNVYIQGISCFQPVKGKISSIYRGGPITYFRLERDTYLYTFDLDTLDIKTDNEVMFAQCARIGDSVIRNGSYLELYQNLNNFLQPDIGIKKSMWFVKSCEGIPYTTDSVNYAFAKAVIFKIALDEEYLPLYYHYRYTVKQLNYEDANMDLACFDCERGIIKVGDTFTVGYNKENPQLNRIFDRRKR